jgi:tripartite-type tricarboxylate transporter receptor subunit TctC
LRISIDAYARLLTRHIGQYIPGHPGFIIQNMPGGGGLRVTNHLYNIAPKDGTAMATVQRGILTSPLLEGHQLQIQYDPMKFNWIGSLNTETGLVVVWHTAPHQTMDDLLKKDMLIHRLPATLFKQCCPHQVQDHFRLQELDRSLFSDGKRRA